MAQPLLDHGGSEVGAGTLHQGAGDVGGAAETVGHSVGVVHFGEEVDDLIHHLQGRLGGIHIAGPGPGSHPR